MLIVLICFVGVPEDLSVCFVTPRAGQGDETELRRWHKPGASLDAHAGQEQGGENCTSDACCVRGSDGESSIKKQPSQEVLSEHLKFRSGLSVEPEML